MKKLVLLASVAALAACNQKPAEEAAPATDASATATTALAMEIDGKPMAGTFEIASSDGKRTMTQTVNDDGTVVSVEGDKTTKGTWTSTGPGHFCITNEGETDASCYTETIGADGTMTSTNDKDPADSWTVKRVESAS